jgi:hypothetical protein
MVRRDEEARFSKLSFKGSPSRDDDDRLDRVGGCFRNDGFGFHVEKPPFLQPVF